MRLWGNVEVSAAAGSGEPEPVPPPPPPSSGRGQPAGTSSNAALYCPMESYRTKSSATMTVGFTARNLLMAAGAFSLRSAGGAGRSN